jgi:uncharacterized pyridoxamine 5'-phosphate oxidase family protein
MDGAELRQIALNIVKECRFSYFASVEGNAPRVRPVSPAHVDGATVWVGSMRSSGKTEQIRQNDRVELCFMSEGHDQVRIQGRAIETTNREKRLNIFRRYGLLRRYFEDVDDPEFILYEVRPERVLYMKEWELEYQEVPL